MNVGKQQSAPGRRAGTPPQRGIDGRFGQVVRDAFPEDERARGVAIAGGGHDRVQLALIEVDGDEPNVGGGGREDSS